MERFPKVRFDIITIFPNLFQGFLTESLISRGQKKKIIKIGVHNLRKWTSDKHQTVDDKPYGGGVGMVLKLEPIYKAVSSLKLQAKSLKFKVDNKKSKIQNLKTRIILFSPRGKKFDQKTVKRLAGYDQLILICGRYEGVDERVAEYVADEIISIGDYVLNGGEVAAMAVIEAVSRMVPGFIAKSESAEKFDHAQYTRPEVFIPKRQETPKSYATGQARDRRKGWNVPKVLLSGDHKKIWTWRAKHLKLGI